ncbi:MAG TPA: YicC/YloC family endoribonuclease [Burkholderiales bacterium]|nr:YicC/YloC family endoribonuclease [Burkholderiales bacterium]
MIQSMTGYAAASAPTARGMLSLELRSVNSRFLDVQLRIPDELRALEPMLRELLSARLSRGKVDCRLLLGAAQAVPAGAEVSIEVLERLRELSEQVVRALPQAAPLRVADVLRWPGVIAEAPADEEATRSAAGELARRALDELVAARAREGGKLAAAIAERVGAMRRRVDALAPHLPQALADYQARLSQKLREALGSTAGADDERVRAELAVFASKVDVDEEITRLRTHFAEVERVLATGGAVGKRLDFLAQELNREANTLASKAASTEITDCALELKVLIEQIREQVQNLE